LIDQRAQHENRKKGQKRKGKTKKQAECGFKSSHDGFLRWQKSLGSGKKQLQTPVGREGGVCS